MSRRTYIFAGGGTGGHLYPALAVLEELSRLEPQARVVFACSNREIDRRIIEPTGRAWTAQPILPMPRRLTGWFDFGRAWLAGRGVASDLVRDLKPAAVFGLGGFAAEPVVTAAARRGVPSCLLSIDAVPGVANRHLAGKVAAIFAQFPETPKAYGDNIVKVQIVGCPVRRSILNGDRAEAVRHFGLHADKKTLFIVPGSLGAASINQAIPLLAGELEALAQDWQIMQVTGPGKLDQAWRGGAMHTVALEFCDRMDLAYAAADLALCRAGASTIGELVAGGIPAVLMPYPYHRDDHQRHNTHAVVAAGSCVLVHDTKDPAANAQALTGGLVGIMKDAAKLTAMRQAAKGMADADAAAKIATWLSKA